MIQFKVSEISNLYVHDGPLRYVNYNDDSKTLDIRMQFPEDESLDDMKECILRFFEVDIIYSPFAFNELDWEEYDSSSILSLDYLAEMNKDGKQGCSFALFFSNRKGISRNAVIIFITTGYNIIYL